MKLIIENGKKITQRIKRLTAECQVKKFVLRRKSFVLGIFLFAIFIGVISLLITKHLTTFAYVDAKLEKVDEGIVTAKKIDIDGSFKYFEVELAKNNYKLGKAHFLQVAQITVDKNEAISADGITIELITDEENGKPRFNISSDGTDKYVHARIVHGATMSFKKMWFTFDFMFDAAQSGFSADELCMIFPDDTYAVIRSNKGEEISRAEDRIVFSGEENMFVLSAIIAIGKSKIRTFSSMDGEISIEIAGVKESEISGTGEIDLIFSKSPQRFSFDTRRLYLKNNMRYVDYMEPLIHLPHIVENDQLSFVITDNKQNLSCDIFGGVHETKISGFSLFPTVMEMMDDNKLTIALSICSLIASVLSLMLNYKKTRNEKKGIQTQ